MDVCMVDGGVENCRNKLIYYLLTRAKANWRIIHKFVGKFNREIVANVLQRTLSCIILCINENYFLNA